MAMKSAFLLISCLSIAMYGCDRGGPASQTPRAPSTQKSAASERLLLLDDAGPTSRAALENLADNSRCEVCHLNMVVEDLAAKHAKVNVGCAKCHGESDAHIADESWASGGNGTAPERMYPPDKINPGCYECHPKDRLDPDLHKAFLAGVSEKKLCTDCHGKHKLVTRKCKWK
jgi:hypothetical protein